MSVSDDIGNLFQRFGGDADRYQEVARDDDAKHAASRWPLLTALDIGHAEPVPGAGRPAPTQARDRASAPIFSPAAGQRAAAQTSAAAQRAADALPPGAVADDSTAAAEHTSGLVRAPLFARAHRHATMPPPAEPVRQAATRFSPPPELQAANERVITAPAATLLNVHTASEPAATTAAAAPDFVASAHSATMPPAIPATPARDQSRPVSSSLFESKLQTFAASSIESAVGAGPGNTQTASRAPAGGSILANLFSAPAPEPAAAQQASRELASVFARLSSAPPAVPTRRGGQAS